jgi:protein-L-isoaspartate(D-aspartate) O-methyltransferase
MRYISTPQRSQATLDSTLGTVVSVDVSRVTARAGGRGGSASDMSEIMSWIDEQLAARGIRDPRVLDAMRRVPRHAFVPEDAQPLAYADRALPIGNGQTISQPYMVAAMTEALMLTGTEHALEIGTGSGYQAAILGELARDVITIERRPELAASARKTLASLGYTNVEVIVGDGTLGYVTAAPFDAILVAAGAPRVPESLKQQLSRDRGRLVIPIGSSAEQRLTLVVREGERFVESLHGGCVFVPLVGVEGWPE